MQDTIETIESHCRSKIEHFEPLDCGFSSAKKILVRFVTGTSWFVKVASDHKTDTWLRKEAMVYNYLKGKHAPHLGFFIDIPSGSIMGLEDLSMAQWKLNWTKQCIANVLEGLGEVSRLKFPFDVPRLEHVVAEFKSWQSLSSPDIERLGEILGCSNWLRPTEPLLRKLSKNAIFAGQYAVHFDLRTDNMCFNDGRLILTDWDWLSIGNPIVDIVTWLPGVYLSGGPHPSEVIHGEFELVSWLAGAWGAQILSNPIDHLESRLGQLQFRQLKVALEWIARGNGLPLPFNKTNCF